MTAPRQETGPDRAPEIRWRDRRLVGKILFAPQAAVSSVGRLAEGAVRVTRKVASTILHPAILLPALGAGAVAIGANRQWFVDAAGAENFAGAQYLQKGGEAINKGLTAAGEVAGKVSGAVTGAVGPTVEWAAKGIGTGARNFWDYARGTDLAMAP